TWPHSNPLPQSDQPIGRTCSGIGATEDAAPGDVSGPDADGPGEPGPAGDPVTGGCGGVLPQPPSTAAAMSGASRRRPIDRRGDAPPNRLTTADGRRRPTCDRAGDG